MCNDASGTMLFARERAVHSKTFIMHRESGIKIESREIQSPNLLIWSQTRCRCAIPPVVFTSRLAELANDAA